ncbi:uncharacterized protein Tco025E_09187, partial [Trypanosoma conorhini]
FHWELKGYVKIRREENPANILIAASGKTETVAGFAAPCVPMQSEEHTCLVANTRIKSQDKRSGDPPTQAWKCSVCGKVKALSGKHLEGKTEVRSDCWPCALKRTFYLTNNQSTDDKKPPAESAFKSAFGALASTDDKKPPAESAFKSAFGALASTDDKKPPAESALTSSRNALGCHTGVWKCTRCGKAKELTGAHLIGKTEVRSDCWPCAKKSTFKLESSVSLGAERIRENTAEENPANILIAASGKTETVAGFAAPCVPMQSEEHTCLVANTRIKSQDKRSGDPPTQAWKCSVCGKVKALSGKHLEGKTEVRSDCWPCALKRTFYLTNNQSTDDKKPPAESAFKSAFGARPRRMIRSRPPSQPSRARLVHRPQKMIRSHPPSQPSRARLVHRPRRMIRSHP